jgi:hypothetical protein
MTQSRLCALFLNGASTILTVAFLPSLTSWASMKCIAAKGFRRITVPLCAFI